MPAIATMNAPPKPDYVTLSEAAQLIYPFARHRSGYFRLYQAIHRHGQTCPVRFSLLSSPTNGRSTTVLARADLPALKAWIESR